MTRPNPKYTSENELNKNIKKIFYLLLKQFLANNLILKSLKNIYLIYYCTTPIRAEHFHEKDWNVLKVLPPFKSLRKSSLDYFEMLSRKTRFLTKNESFIKESNLLIYQIICWNHYNLSSKIFIIFYYGLLYSLMLSAPLTPSI